MTDERSVGDAWRPVTLSVHCIDLPAMRPSEVFGLQDRDLNIDEGEATGRGGRRFLCELRARPASGGSGVILVGPWAHGPPAARFLYLTWLDRADTPHRVVRRIKVSLASVRWSDVAALEPGGSLEVTVDGRRAGSARLPAQGWTPSVLRSPPP
jgi:hypothetical protein